MAVFSNWLLDRRKSALLDRMLIGKPGLSPDIDRHHPLAAKNGFYARVGSQHFMVRMRSVTALECKYICTSVMNFIIESQEGCLSSSRHLIQMLTPEHYCDTGDLVFRLKVMLVDPKMNKGHLMLVCKPHRDITNVLLQVAIARGQPPTMACLWELTNHLSFRSHGGTEPTVR